MQIDQLIIIYYIKGVRYNKQQLLLNKIGKIIIIEKDYFIIKINNNYRFYIPFEYINNNTIKYKLLREENLKFLLEN